MISTTATFEVSQEVLFDTIADVAGQTKWQSGIEHVTVTSGDGRSTGTRFTARFAQTGLELKFRGEVVECTRPTTLRYRLEADEAALDIELSIDPLGSGSRLEHKVVLRLRSFALKMLKGVIEARLAEKVEADIRGLRALLTQ